MLDGLYDLMAMKWVGTGDDSFMSNVESCARIRVKGRYIGEFFLGYRLSM